MKSFECGCHSHRGLGGHQRPKEGNQHLCRGEIARRLYEVGRLGNIGHVRRSRIRYMTLQVGGKGERFFYIDSLEGALGGGASLGMYCPLTTYPPLGHAFPFLKESLVLAF